VRVINEKLVDCDSGLILNNHNDNESVVSNDNRSSKKRTSALCKQYNVNNTKCFLDIPLYCTLLITQVYELV